MNRSALYLFLFTLILFQNRAYSQEFIDLDGHGQVSISYQIVSSNQGVIDITSIKGKINYGEYEDLKLRIKLEVKTLETFYHIKLIPIESYKNRSYGFRLSNKPPLKISKEGSYYIIYTFEPDKLDETFPSQLALTFWLMNRGKAVKKFRSAGQAYQLAILSDSSVEKKKVSIQEISDIALLNCFKEADNNCNYSKAQICKEANYRYKKFKEASSGRLKYLVKSCREISSKLTKEKDVVTNVAKQENEIDCSVLVSKYEKSSLPDKIQLLKDFIKKHPKSNCFGGQIQKKLIEVEKQYIEQNYTGSNSPSRPKKKIYPYLIALICVIGLLLYQKFTLKQL